MNTLFETALTYGFFGCLALAGVLLIVGWIVRDRG